APRRHRGLLVGPRGRLEAARHFVEIELLERDADQRAAIRLRDASRLQLVDEAVEALEIAVVERDADDLVVSGLGLDLAGSRASRLGRVERAGKPPLHFVGIEHAGGAEPGFFFSRCHLPSLLLSAADRLRDLVAITR